MGNGHFGNGKLIRGCMSHRAFQGLLLISYYQSGHFTLERGVFEVNFAVFACTITILPQRSQIYQYFPITIKKLENFFEKQTKKIGYSYIFE